MLSRDPAPAPAGGGGTDKPDVLDAAALAQLRSLDPDGTNRLLERVVKAFDTSTARLLPQLRQAGENGDLESARVAAHTLKSASGSIGALQLSRQCAALELQIRSQAVVGLTTQVDSIIAEAGRVRVALAALVGPAA